MAKSKFSGKKKASGPYSEASRILNEIWFKKKGFKSVVYDKKTGDLLISKQTYAQVCQVLKYKLLLDDIWNNRGDVGKNSTSVEIKNEGLLYILLYELLLGPNKAIRGGGALKRQLMEQETELRNLAEEIVESFESLSSHDQDNATKLGFPRYIRVNTLWSHDSSLTRILKQLPAGTGEIYRDSHVPDLLVLPNFSDMPQLQRDQYLRPRVVIQDKSSCFSALCLQRGFGDVAKTKNRNRVYLDACAAPGNKTCHLAALVQQHWLETSEKEPCPSVYALDRSDERCATLQRRMDQLVPSVDKHSNRLKVTVFNQDFLKTPHKQRPELADVTDILLDPSCSGSGIFTSLDRHADVSNEEEKNRLENLSKFQLTALCHAMKNFPKVERIVYSTCSIHEQENEGVVAQALTENSDWELVSPSCLEHWPRRGNAYQNGEDSTSDPEKDKSKSTLSEEQARRLIRVDDPVYKTNGFFVACFQRRGSSDSKSRLKEKPKKKSKTNASAALEVSGLKDANEFWAQLPVYDFSSHQSSPWNKLTKAEKKTVGQDTSKKEEASTKDTNPALPKKIAKRMEWKKRQREAKEARMRKKAKQT